MKTIELIFKKCSLFFFGPILRKTDFPDDVLHILQEKSVLFIRPEKIGDIFITFPVFDILRRNYPGIKISIVGSMDCLPLIKNDPRFSNIFLYKKRIWFDLAEILKIRREKFDCVIDLVGCDSVTSLLLTTFSANGRPRIAIGKEKHKSYYNFNFDLRYNNTGHVISNSLKMLEAFNLPYEETDGYAPPFIDERSRQKANNFINYLNISKTDVSLIGYNLSAGSPDRILDEKTSLELVDKLLNYDSKNRIMLFALGSQRETANRMISRHPDEIYLIPDDFTLIEASVVLSRLDFFITPDTSLVHIARSFKIPVVAMYKKYMENYRIWYPYGQTNGTIVSDNADNISDITSDAIFSKYKKIRKAEMESQCQNSRP